MKTCRKIISRIFNLDNLFSAIIVFIVLQFFSTLFRLDFLNQIQNIFQDFNVTDLAFSKLIDQSKTKIDTNIVIINIDNLNRKGIARQIEIVNRYGPKVIGIDAFYRERKSDELDIPLASSLSQVKNLVMASELKFFNKKKDRFDTLWKSNLLFTSNAKTGFVNVIIRNEEQFRTVRLFTPIQTAGPFVEKNFAVKIAEIYDSNSVRRLFERKNSTEIINFRRNIDKYLTIDWRELFEKQDSLHFIKDKIVLMGYLGPDTSEKVTEDIFFTPMNERYVGKSYPDMYGVVVHANTISMILDGDYFIQMSDNVSLLLTFLLCYCNMIIFYILRARFEDWYEPASITIIFFELFLYFFGIALIFDLFNLEIEITGSFFAIVFCTTAFEFYNDSVKPLFREGYRRVYTFINKSDGEEE